MTKPRSLNYILINFCTLFLFHSLLILINLIYTHSRVEWVPVIILLVCLCLTLSNHNYYEVCYSSSEQVEIWNYYYYDSNIINIVIYIFLGI